MTDIKWTLDYNAGSSAHSSVPALKLFCTVATVYEVTVVVHYFHTTYEIWDVTCTPDASCEVGAKSCLASTAVPPLNPPDSSCTSFC